VLLIGPSLDILGGQSVQADRLLAHLRDEPDLEAAFLPVNPRLPGPLRLLQRVKYLRTVVTSLRYGAALLRNVPRYDVLHVFSASYWSFLLAPTPALLAAKLFRKRAILNYHSGEAEDHLGRWRSARAIVRLADAVAVPSGYLVDVFARFGVRARPIYNIVDTTRFRFRERRPLRPVFFSNRNLEPMYNVGCLLRAFAVVQGRFAEASLCLAGDGTQRGALERLTESLGLKHVRFLGRVPNDRMPALYAAADVYLNASDIDNMPLSIIEAFAAGTPVISTDPGGIPYIVTHEKTGLLVPRNDHEAMAAQALRLLDDAPLAGRIAEEARAACGAYEWAAVRQQWLTLYRELAS
jgi:glycosyltransferase involved in cell wall biosynthesis